MIDGDVDVKLNLLSFEESKNKRCMVENLRYLRWIISNLPHLSFDNRNFLT